ncbi:MAG: radical SAM family heme chaperone HemW [Candidatus Zixiibacteriota bacterium]
MGLYLHFPFCTNLCHYCDFYKDAFDTVAQKRFFKALRTETELVLAAFEHEPVEIKTLYIGGGTPSLVDPELLNDWLATVSAFAQFQLDFEFTIEANPESLTDEFARRAVEAGANRIVIGVQSFTPASLQKLGRKQRNKDIYQAFYNARIAGFSNIGADLIFGLPGQTMKKMRTDIDRLIALEPKHISFYQLTVEPDTVLERRLAEGKVELPDDDTCADMYRLGSHLLMDHKFDRYEISNFALDGYAARHNCNYWNGTPYIAFGPSGHGYLNNHRYSNVGDVREYVSRIEAGLSPIDFVETLTEEEKLDEAILLGLRQGVGIDKPKLIRRFGEPALAILEGEIVADFIKRGYLTVDEGFLRLTDDGFLVADRIIYELVS